MKLWIQSEDPAQAEALEALLTPLAEQCVAKEGLDGRFQAAVLMVDGQTIRQTNLRTRGVDRVTDVLSFPETRYPKGTAKDNAKRLRQALDPDTGRIHLGDIMICLDQAARQAEEYGHSLKRETAYLFVHGLCHLLGYDHEDEARQRAMRALEEAVLGSAGLGRVDDGALLALAWEARAQAYTPYSGYPVGACLLGEDGRTFLGCNVENASYGLTMCAERNAVFKAVSEGARRFVALAVTAEGSLPFPCGACRQVLYEFSPELRVLVADKGRIVETTLAELLPNGFGPNALPERPSKQTDSQTESQSV